MGSDRSFTERLQARRIECGLSKSGLAREVGVTGTCVWNWEQGNTHPRLENRAALARTLRTTWTFLETGLPQGIESNRQENAALESSSLQGSEVDSGQSGTPRGKSKGDLTQRPSSGSAAPTLPLHTGLKEGERELMSGLLSRDTKFRIIVSGPVGVREIERLIEKLAIDKQILTEATPSGVSSLTQTE